MHDTAPVTLRHEAQTGVFASDRFLARYFKYVVEFPQAQALGS
jgi:hypothetical protein